MKHRHPCAKPQLPQLAERLRGTARKLTGQRHAILQILRAHHGPLTIREIQARLGSENCDLATIYRSMHLLEELSLVKRFDFGPGGARFELLGEGDDGHHHHLVCTRCAEVVELAECFPTELEKKIASDNGFVAVTHKLEFFGLCPRCQSRAE